MLNKRFLSVGLTTMVLAGTLWAQAPGEELRGAKRPKAPGFDDFRCYETGVGWLYTKNPEAVPKIVEDVQDAARSFRTRFGRSPRRGAIVVASLGQSVGTDSLKAAGARWVLPWFDLTSKESLATLSVSIRKQIEEQMPRATKEQVDEALEKSLARMRGEAGKPGSSERALGHELGHAWFMDAFWPERKSSGGLHYGGPAADWLDESAAILMEGAELTASRWKLLKERFEDPTHAKYFLPLREFFANPHPRLAAAKEMPKAPPTGVGGGGSGTMVRVSRADPNDPSTLTTAAFYSQCRALIDFLLEKSGQPDLFRRIAEAEAKGTPFPGWLRQHGAEFGLPTSVEELDTAWRAWVRKKIAALGSGV